MLKVTTVFRRGFLYLYLKLRRVYLVDLVYFYIFRVKVEPKRILVIGDSHATTFNGNNRIDEVWPLISTSNSNYFRGVRLGALTAFGLQNKQEYLKNALSFRTTNYVKGNCFLFLCFGEIDIRIHLFSRKNEKTADEMMISAISNLIEFAILLRSEGHLVGIIGPVINLQDNVVVDGYMPSGTYMDRVEYTAHWNKKLFELCSDNSLLFIGINDILSAMEFKVRKYYYLDDFHLNSKVLKLYENIIRLNYPDMLG